MDKQLEISIDLCDARQIPPRITKIKLSRLNTDQPWFVGQALLVAGIAKSADDPEISRKGAFGIFGVRQTWNDPIYDGDRLELYQPILIDPKLSRRKKANQRKDAKLQSKARQRALDRTSK